MAWQAAILDVDGVLVDTAPLHERAWASLFEEVLAVHDAQPPFTHEDYRRHVDGKPRRRGLKDFLDARDLAVDDEELERLAERKNALFHELLDEDEVRVHDDAVRAVETWREHGLPIAFVSASRNAGPILERVGLAPLADAHVDGCDAAEQGLDGKPELLREAASRLDVAPARAVVIEDAEAGVQAAADEGFGLVVGLARNGGADGLRSSGADRVVGDLSELHDVAEPGTRRASELPSARSASLVDAALGHRQPLVFLDYDGTLTPIVDDPDDAVLSTEMRQTLQALSRCCTVGIVSGRNRDDVEARVDLDGLWYLGCHGFERRDPEGRVHTVDAADAAAPQLDTVEEEWRQAVDDDGPLTVERKAFMIGLHYRGAPEDAVRRARSMAEDAAAAHGALRVHHGQKVVELWPDVPWDKGRAISEILDDLPGVPQAVLPVYVGDGRTDEDAFRSLSHAGLTIVVGEPRWPTHAQLSLSDPDDVRRFLQDLTERVRSRGEEACWRLSWEGYDPERERLREALTTLGNGVFATRGAAAFASAGPHHYPGTYLAGGYDRIPTVLEGRTLVHEDLVNLPNWTCLSIRGEGGRWLDLDQLEVLDHRQTLDLRRGVLERDLRVRDDEGRTTRVTSVRLVSMADPNVASMRWTVVPEDWSGRLQVRSGLDGTVRNAGVPRYADLRGDHLVGAATGHDEDRIWLEVRTRQSHLRVAMGARTRVSGGDAPDDRRVEQVPGRLDQLIAVEVAAGEAVQVDKDVVVHSSRDPALSEPLRAVRRRLTSLPGHEALRTAHEQRWAQLWRRVDMRITSGDDDHHEVQRILRLHLFHLLQVASPHIVDRDVSVPARGLHGEAYRGKVFWDELFILPLLDYALPQLTRELLLYRWRRLGEARQRARDAGLDGAMYPWQSGASGEEENPELHLNPRSGRWVPDETHLQRHIGAAVAHNVWRYVQTTGDQEFLALYGAEMLVEIARFWASLATWDEDLQRHRICGVVGPDEFHTRYPDADRPGLDDNAYTNVMAAWCLRIAEQALQMLPDERRFELLDQLGATDADRQRWRRVATTLRVPFLGEQPHVIAQFDGWEALDELDWDAYRKRYDDLQRLDRILEDEDDTPNRYKLTKQADVLMLFYLFTAEELTEQLATMGVRFDPAWIPENVEYYASRTSHGSTLSRVVHSWVMARADRARSWTLLCTALRSDIDDIQGGTTSEGIHLGAMAGTVDLIRRGYTGAVLRDGVLWLEPQLPEELACLQLRFRVRGAWIAVRIERDRLCVTHIAGRSPVARVGVADEVVELERDEHHVFALD